MINNSTLFNNPYESSIQQLLQIEGQKRSQLQNEQQALESKKSALSDIDSKLSSLDSLAGKFIQQPEEQTSPLAGTSSDPDAVGIVSAGGMDHPGSYSIDVTQVAKEDIMLSDTLAAEGTDFNAAGTGSLEISIGDGQSATVSVNTAGLSNMEVMEEIASQVNAELGDHVNASVLQPENGTAKLSFKSTETGSAHRITVSNQQDDLAGLNLANVAAEEELDAHFKIDGVNFKRSSNLVDDAVSGLTFEINKETDGNEFLDVSRDIEGAEENIQSFIDAFNEVNSLIREKTRLNGDTGERGALQEERSIRNLSFTMRNTVSLPVDSLAGSSVYSLSSMGIELGQDGSMSIEDSDKLTEALTEHADEVSALFSADDGIAASLQQQISMHVGSGSTIFQSIEDGFDRKIDRLTDRIASEEEYLVQKEEELRAEFAELDQVINDGQRQFDNVMNFRSQYGF